MTIPATFPISAIEADFHQHIESQHLVIEAETGSGKSTHLPVWASDHGRVLVIQPRRIACTSLAEFIATQKDEPVGKSVGYAIRFEGQFSENTRIVFATPGVALRWLSEDGLAHFDIVMVDEMHLRRWDTDILTAMLLETGKHRLIITSATLDANKLTAYVSGMALKAEGRNYPVAVRYIAKDSRFGPDIRGIDRKVQQAVADIWDETEGDILVFLPGRKEISQCQSILRGLDADIIPLHASVSDGDRQRALTATQHNSLRRIILATNVAETSLTIPGVTVVIDSGLERRTHQRNGRTVLGLHSISRASAEQRKGRAGRVAPGICLRLYGSAAPLEATTPPDLQREELVEPMLAAACCGYRLADLPLPDSLPEKTLAAATSSLQKMGAIDGYGHVTEHGKVLYPLPIDTLFAHLISVIKEPAVKEAMVDLAAALSLPQRLWSMPSSEHAIDELSKWEPLGCDAVTLIRLVREPVPEFLTVDDDMRKEARLLSNQMREALNLPALKNTSPLYREPLIQQVMQTAPELVFVRRERRRQALGNGMVECSTGRDTRFPDSAEAAIVFDQHAVPGKGVKQNLAFATCIAPVTFRQLADSCFGEEQPGQTVTDDNGQCLTEIHRVFVGRVIATRTEVPKGEMAREVAVDQILSGEIMPGLADTLSTAIHQWNLYLALGQYNPDFCSRSPQAVHFETWLTQQIEDLGIESPEDLQLFEPSDFIFDGIPEWERKDFDEAYPHEVKLSDLTLRIEYDPPRKQVTAIHVDGGRKADPKRWELPRWQGWRVQYRKASRTIDIK